MATATTKKPAAPTTRKPAVKKAPATPVDGIEGAEPAAKGPAALRLKELVDRVAAATGGKKKGVKEIVEATLSQLGLALGNGEMLNLPALGRVRVAKGGAEGAAMTLKLRPAAAEGAKKKPAKETLAEPVDQG
ncbi:MAG: HU family DNA-binding protein [Paracoccaceae bacterium]